MNPDRFTIKTREAITAAQALAEERRHPQVTPEHLLAALLQHTETANAPVLRKVAPDIASVRGENTAAPAALPTLGSGPERTGPSDALGQVLRAADRERRDLNDDYVSVEHLVLSLAGHASKAGEALRANGARK